MGRLEDRHVLAIVPTGRDTEAADHSRAEVGEDVAVEVRQHEHVVLLRALHELHAHVVDDAVVELDVLVLRRDLARDAQPEPVAEFHDVRLVHAGDLLAAVLARVVERELEDEARPRDRDRLDRDAGVVVAQLPALRLHPGDQLLRVVGSFFVLDADVEILGVLAHDHEVGLGIARADPLVGLAGPDARRSPSGSRRRSAW